MGICPYVLTVVVNDLAAANRMYCMYRSQAARNGSAVPFDIIDALTYLNHSL